ncbi:DUF805 domain-containing protein [Conservatibacter flavescens]|uniref:DUF805 domain-containing protein n=1 Tax=Conservatibacter flavescens TaxID=28161 RepID=A0A2M8S083_9PAST|nr:DUF805 domain-containing protein [Conservatibacter flavescens]PJG84528.1 DUF805 domain-containing protein [Conservatibacter flavescens]
MNWYLSVIKQYVNFNGRARRKEYWFFTLFNFLIAFALSILDLAFGLFSYESNIGLFSGIYGLFVFLPTLAVSVRRLHDINRSGWWLLIGLVPILGAIVIFVFMLFDGTPGVNRFGENPKNISIEGPLVH